MSGVPDGVQRFTAPLTGHAVFLVVTVSDQAVDGVRDVLRDLGGLVQTVRFRDPADGLSCTVGIGARIWPVLVGGPLPRELHPFTPVAGAVHTAVSTPGDLLFHIRSDRADLCFEFERLLVAALGDGIQVEDETSCFRSFDRRDLLGFVDGTANPVGTDAADSVLVGDEDPAFVGGTYVVVQKYLHPLDRWQALPTEAQERIMGRTKADNLELDDATSGQKSHKTLATIVDDAGVEHDIIRDNMPFGRPGHAEFGTYFLGQSRALWVIETMLRRMFVGDPPGVHDRLLDFSVPKTGTTFFAPSAGLLSTLGDAVDVPATASPSVEASPTSLGIGANRARVSQEV